MISLPSVLISEKNNLSQAEPWLVLLEIQFRYDTIRLVRNEADITWGGYTWTRFPFELDSTSEARRSEVPTTSLSVSNINRVMQSYVEQYDGGVDADAIIRVVHAAHLDITTPAIRLDYTVMHARADSKTVTFQLGATNLFRRQFPSGRFRKNTCRFKFKSTECGYVGAGTTCDKTLSACRGYANTLRFGGFPGAGYGGLDL